MPTWDEFAWAAFLYGGIGGDLDYQGLMKQAPFLKKLRTNPNGLRTDEIRQHLIKEFLNRWKCRVENTQQSAQAIRTKLQAIMPYLRVLNNPVIATVDFAQAIHVNNNQMSVEQVIAQCYATLRKIGFKFAATATSKLLHILQPELFIMWDKDILRHYHKNDPRVVDTGQGYCIYLQIMQEAAREICQSFWNASLSRPAGVNQNPADYLSTQMKYDPPKTLAKYLDEYNWVTITNDVPVPPPWHP